MAGGQIYRSRGRRRCRYQDDVEGSYLKSKTKGSPLYDVVDDWVRSMTTLYSKFGNTNLYDVIYDMYHEGFCLILSLSYFQQSSSFRVYLWPSKHCSNFLQSFGNNKNPLFSFLYSFFLQYDLVNDNVLTISAIYALIHNVFSYYGLPNLCLLKCCSKLFCHCHRE